MGQQLPRIECDVENFRNCKGSFTCKFKHVLGAFNWKFNSHPLFNKGKANMQFLQHKDTERKPNEHLNAHQNKRTLPRTITH